MYSFLYQLPTNLKNMLNGVFDNKPGIWYARVEDGGDGVQDVEAVVEGGMGHEELTHVGQEIFGLLQNQLVLGHLPLSH